ncbi:AMP-binding protein [Micromonospora sp. NPDC049275]|uniref:AMP-binding protein n=1 Tax=Micromonospora sp. NPDC049275 TaxID=3364268 RepID=UPI003714F61E
MTADAVPTLYQWFAETAVRVPDATALAVGPNSFSYRELSATAAGVARRLRELTPRPRVGLLASRTPLAYAGYLGVLRAGGTVVPLNPEYPAGRNRMLAERGGLDVVLADMEADVAFASAAGIPVLGPEDVDAADPAEPPTDACPDDVAYILFTSGSTGVPKGVPIRHRNAAEFVRLHVDRYDVRPGCRLSQTFGLTFDPSVFDMFVAWAGGATLVVPTREELLDPVTYVADRALTHWYSVPSIISMARSAGTLIPGSMPSLRWSLFAGEQLTLDHAAAWADAAVNSTVENLYGPTELTVTVTTYRLPPDRGSWPVTSNGTVPIGRIHPHLEHRLESETGELQVRGPQRFAGYLDPADDAGHFLDPRTGLPTATPGPDAWYRTGDRVGDEQGQLVHLGRLDQQVKVLGQRIEPGEIEAALRTRCGVDDAVVLVGDADRLVAVYTGAERTPAELRAQLRAHLPAHMVPRRFVHRTDLPLNANGKVDRLACGRL